MILLFLNKTNSRKTHLMPIWGSTHHITKIQVLIKSKLIIKCILSLTFKKYLRNGWLKGFTGMVRKIAGECYLQTIGSVPILFIFKYFLKNYLEKSGSPQFFIMWHFATFLIQCDPIKIHTSHHLLAG